MLKTNHPLQGAIESFLAANRNGIEWGSVRSAELDLRSKTAFVFPSRESLLTS
jgi:hypothetical protein